MNRNYIFFLLLAVLFFLNSFISTPSKVHNKLVSCVVERDSLRVEVKKYKMMAEHNAKMILEQKQIAEKLYEEALKQSELARKTAEEAMKTYKQHEQNHK